MANYKLITGDNPKEAATYLREQGWAVTDVHDKLWMVTRVDGYRIGKVDSRILVQLANMEVARKFFSRK